jgi:Glycoside hydrolase family 44/PA14 domain/Fibronectin type III domain
MRRLQVTRLQLGRLESRLAPAVVAVDATANVHAIDPNIYGSAFASTAQLTDLHLPINRNGGNAADTYSFVQDATNRGSDWFFESIAWGSGNGNGMDAWINETIAGGAQPNITLNLFDWAARVGANRDILGSFSVSKYGAQQSTDPWRPDLGNGVRTNGSNVTGNDPTDAYTANNPTIERAWIQHLIDTFGTSQTGGVKYYTLGNEPGIWHHTHRDIHPDGNTLPELRDRVIAYASMVKSLDPAAKILGFEEWGWSNYFVSGEDGARGNWGATYDGLNAQQWLLNQMRLHDTAAGQRLLDYFTLHFYPQGGQFSDDLSQSMQLLRNRSTRSLWDPNYVDESWIASTGINGGKVNLINMMKGWVNAYYPGTKLGVTEYNWGAEGDMNGATTQADIWGIFGREGLDLANRWTTPGTGTPTYLAMKMYRNYDGAGSAFGETSVGASVANPDQVSAFASVRASDGALTVMVVNKNLYSSGNPGARTSITLNLSNFANAGVAQPWQVAAIAGSNQGQAAIAHLSDITLSGNSLTVNVPMESVTLFVIPPAAAVPPAPTGLDATAGEGRVTLNWNAAPTADSYNVYRGTASGGEALLQSGITGTTFTDTAVTNGTTYHYQVTAVNAAGESSRSAEVSARPQLPAPSNLRAAVISGSQIDLTWTDNSAAETGFVLERATNSTFTSGFQSTTLGPNTTSASATGLAGGVTYWFRVRATSANGPSVNSNTVSATTPGTSGTGLLGVYFNNADFTGSTVQQIDSTVNFNWGLGAPTPGIDADTFSVRWTGQVKPTATGSYRFQTQTDAGVRLWLDNRLLISNWSDHPLTTNTSTVVLLVAGRKYDIKLEYHENTGVAVARLLWQRFGLTAFAPIPQAQLYPATPGGSGSWASSLGPVDLTGAIPGSNQTVRVAANTVDNRATRQPLSEPFAVDRVWFTG